MWFKDILNVLSIATRYSIPPWTVHAFEHNYSWTAECIHHAKLDIAAHCSCCSLTSVAVRACVSSRAGTSVTRRITNTRASVHAWVNQAVIHIRRSWNKPALLTDISCRTHERSNMSWTSLCYAKCLRKLTRNEYNYKKRSITSYELLSGF